MSTRISEVPFAQHVAPASMHALCTGKWYLTMHGLRTWATLNAACNTAKPIFLALRQAHVLALLHGTDACSACCTTACFAAHTQCDAIVVMDYVRMAERL